MIRFFAALVLFIFSCQKPEDNYSYERDYWGNINITKEGKIWQPKIIGYNDMEFVNVYTLELVFIEKKVGRQMLTIFGLPLINKKGKFGIKKQISENTTSDLSPSPSSYYSASISDTVGGDLFTVDTSKQNFIIISDTTNNQIKGSFEINFIRHPTGGRFIEKEDTIKFSCSLFNTRIDK